MAAEAILAALFTVLHEIIKGMPMIVFVLEYVKRKARDTARSAAQSDLRDRRNGYTRDSATA